MKNDLGFLNSIGEWAASGFYEGLDLPWPRSYGLAYRRLYEHMTVNVPEGKYLIPHEPLENARTMGSHSAWHAEALICDFNHDRGLRVNAHLVAGKKTRFPEHATAIDELVADLGRRFQYFGGYTHSNPDMRRIVGEGFLSMERELKLELKSLESATDPDRIKEKNLLQAVEDYVEGVKQFHSATSAALRLAAERKGPDAERMRRISKSFDSCFMNPSETFLQGLLAVNFAWMLDGCDSIGRFDQVLGDLFEKDIQSGKIDLEFVRILLDELWQNFERLNAWNLQIGGYTSDGKDGVNALTYECLEASGRNHCRRPNVAFRITKKTPEKALLRALEVLRDGSGRPALYNDDLYVQTLRELDLGIAEEDVREIGFGGCTETMIAGLSNVGSLDGEINLAKAMELALHDGFDPIAGRQAGPHIGKLASFRKFDEFVEGLKKQIHFQAVSFANAMSASLSGRLESGDPKLYRTFFTRDCIKRHKSFEAGGARYNWSIISYQGIANLIDSLAAVRKCIFEDGSVGADQLIEALAADYVGHEPMRKRLLKAPKFGNDDDSVDETAREVLEYAWKTLYSFEPPRGGRYLASCIVFATYGAAGQAVGALPDGRRSKEVLADCVGPVQGRDTKGPTAMLNSVTRLPLTLAAGTPVLNMRFQKSLLSTPTGLKSVADMVRSFFNKGGMQMQVSVVSKKEMISAQKEPEKHGDLIVRIGGYSEYFTRLDRPLQDSVIARTEHKI